MADSFKLDLSKLVKNIKGFEDRFDVAMRAKCDIFSQQLQQDAQDNARWTNRTGEARRRLNGSYKRVANGYNLILAHGVDYGIWLELANEKRFSIIPETIEYTGTFVIMPGFEDFMNKLK